MSYKWRPSKAQRKAFAIRMQDPTERQHYESRKAVKSEARRANSQFDYNSAGGKYVPHKYQYESAEEMLQSGALTIEQIEAAELVISAYACNQSVHHDYIHIVNEWERRTK